MRTMLAVLVSAFAVQGCKSQKVIAVETEIAATKARIATLEKHRQELNGESKKLQVERKTFSQQADEAALANQRLVAAAYVLQNEPIPDGIQLDEALRSKSPKLGTLAATIVQRQLPCVDEKAEGEPEYPESNCQPPPLDDSCEGVSQTSTQSFRWTCQQPAGSVPMALCLSSAELADTTYPVAVPTSHVEGDVVRLAFERKGRLVVADWPPPSLDLYTPVNWSELATCESENSHAQCVRTCDERHGRLSNGCDGWADGSGEGEGGPDDGEQTEPYEVRAAREAAERADREAAEARDELSYQECLAGCETGAGEPETPARVSLDYKRSPAPGLFEFDVGLRDEEGHTAPHALVISFPALHEQLAGTPPDPDARDTVEDLVAALDVASVIEGKVADGQRVLAGLAMNGNPVATRISMDGKKAPVTLELDEVCAFADDTRNKKLQDGCVQARAQREEAKKRADAAAALAAAKAAAKDAGIDAGVDAGTVAPKDAGADAGVTP